MPFLLIACQRRGRVGTERLIASPTLPLGGQRRGMQDRELGLWWNRHPLIQGLRGSSSAKKILNKTLTANIITRGRILQFHQQAYSSERVCERSSDRHCAATMLLGKHFRIKRGGHGTTRRSRDEISDCLHFHVGLICFDKPTLISTHGS